MKTMREQIEDRVSVFVNLVDVFRSFQALKPGLYQVDVAVDHGLREITVKDHLALALARDFSVLLA